jgi:hypothetical protein
VVPQKDFVEAIIRGINRAQGLLTLKTEIGVMQVQLAPEETCEFQVGYKVWMLSPDRIVV